MKLIHRGTPIMCDHGGRVQLPSASRSATRGRGFVRRSDLCGAQIIGCTQVGPGRKPCDTVTTVISGTAPKLRVDGEHALTDAAVALTNGVPLSYCRPQTSGVLAVSFSGESALLPTEPWRTLPFQTSPNQDQSAASPLRQVEVRITIDLGSLGSAASPYGDSLLARVCLAQKTRFHDVEIPVPTSGEPVAVMLPVAADEAAFVLVTASPLTEDCLATLSMKECSGTKETYVLAPKDARKSALPDVVEGRWVGSAWDALQDSELRGIDAETLWRMSSPAYIKADSAPAWSPVHIPLEVPQTGSVDVTLVPRYPRLLQLNDARARLLSVRTSSSLRHLANPHTTDRRELALLIEHLLEGNKVGDLWLTIQEHEISSPRDGANPGVRAFELGDGGTKVHRLFLEALVAETKTALSDLLERMDVLLSMLKEPGGDSLSEDLEGERRRFAARNGTLECFEAGASNYLASDHQVRAMDRDAARRLVQGTFVEFDDCAVEALELLHGAERAATSLGGDTALNGFADRIESVRKFQFRIFHAAENASSKNTGWMSSWAFLSAFGRYVIKVADAASLPSDIWMKLTSGGQRALLIGVPYGIETTKTRELVHSFARETFPYFVNGTRVTRVIQKNTTTPTLRVDFNIRERRIRIPAPGRKLQGLLLLLSTVEALDQLHRLGNQTLDEPNAALKTLNRAADSRELVENAVQCVQWLDRSKRLKVPTGLAMKALVVVSVLLDGMRVIEAYSDRDDPNREWELDATAALISVATAAGMALLPLTGTAWLAFVLVGTISKLLVDELAKSRELQTGLTGVFLRCEFGTSAQRPFVDLPSHRVLAGRKILYTKDPLTSQGYGIARLAILRVVAKSLKGVEFFECTGNESASIRVDIDLLRVVHTIDPAVYFHVNDGQGLCIEVKITSTKEGSLETLLMPMDSATKKPIEMPPNSRRYLELEGTQRGARWGRHDKNSTALVVDAKCWKPDRRLVLSSTGLENRKYLMISLVGEGLSWNGHIPGRLNGTTGLLDPVE